MKSTKIIRSIRAKRNLTQDDVSLLLGITRQTYNSIENNFLNVELDKVFEILKIFEVSTNELDEFFVALKQDYMSYNQGE